MALETGSPLTQTKLSASGLAFLPSYFTRQANLTFVVVTSFILVFFIRRVVPLQWVVFNLVEVFSFFAMSAFLSNRWKRLSPEVFGKKLLWFGFIIRLFWVIFSYFFYNWMTGQPFEFEAADSKGYHGEGIWLAGLLRDQKWNVYTAYIGKNYSDMGYPFYLGNLYYFFGESVLIPRLLKAVLGSYTCLFVYKIGRSNFGESTGRIAGIMAMVLPNLIYYCGLHVKETEMVFLMIAFIYLADKLIRAPQTQLVQVLLLLLLGGSLFFLRTVLAACIIGSVMLGVLFTSQGVSSMGKRIGLIFVVLIGGVLLIKSPLASNMTEYMNARDKNLSRQMSNYASRANGQGNKFAQYGSRSIFMPFMLMAPFPTLINIPDQQNAMMMGGAYFTRNVYAFFVFIGLIALYKQKKLGDHVLLLSALFSYVFVLASSGFAFSERFHLPLLPLLLIFAAYGVSQMNGNNKKYYTPYLLFTALIVIGWNWFKLAGRS